MLSPVPSAASGASTGGSTDGPVDVAVHDLEQVEPVLAGRGRPVAGARRVAPIRAELTGELPREPVVREHDVRDAIEELGLGAVEPGELRDRERRDRDRTAGLGPPRGAGRELTDQPARVRRGLGVVPELRRPQHLARAVEHHEPVLLRGDGHPRDVTRQVVTRLGPRRLQGPPPHRRVLLGARRRGRRVRRPAVTDEATRVCVADLDLGRLRRRVDPRDEWHPLTLGSTDPGRGSEGGSEHGGGAQAGAGTKCDAGATRSSERSSDSGISGCRGGAR